MAKEKKMVQGNRRRVTFSIEAASACEVILMGDFNNWNRKKHPMKTDGSGIWSKSVLLDPGEYEYKFLVDGQWWEDPKNDQSCINEFGTKNSVLSIK